MKNVWFILTVTLRHAFTHKLYGSCNIWVSVVCSHTCARTRTLAHACTRCNLWSFVVLDLTREAVQSMEFWSTSQIVGCTCKCGSRSMCARSSVFLQMRYHVLLNCHHVIWHSYRVKGDFNMSWGTFSMPYNIRRHVPCPVRQYDISPYVLVHGAHENKVKFILHLYTVHTCSSGTLFPGIVSSPYFYI
jgi:hypothetical protein